MVEQPGEIAPEFGSSALRSSLFIIFVSCCKYKFHFCKVKSVLASENDIFVDGSARRRRGRPATGRSVDSLEAQSGQSGVDVEILCGLDTSTKRGKLVKR